MRSNSSIFPSESLRDSSIFPRRRRFSKMFSAGGQVPTQMEAPASAIALAMANPNPPSSATPATSARLPERSMGSMRAHIARAALAAGMVDAVAGGSGVIAVPALLAAGLPPHLALGTNKAQGVFGTCASTLRYARAGLLDARRARVTFPAGLAGSLCGAALVLLVPPSTLQPVVLVLLVVVAVALALRPAPRNRTSLSTATPSSPSTWARRAPRLAAAAVALVLGAYDGFFGPGAGTFLILAFAFLFDLPLQRAS